MFRALSAPINASDYKVYCPPHPHPRTRDDRLFTRNDSRPDKSRSFTLAISATMRKRGARAAAVSSGARGQRRILVTSALPYANGPVHLGHLLENIQTDIWVRFQRLVGNQCIHVCAEDAHGTATMLKAQEEGMTPAEWGESMRASHAADFARFHIAHDNFHSTHSDENRYYSELIFRRLVEKGHIFTEEVEQLYDPDARLFLADRYVRGACPRCGSEDQPGDNCDVCGATYDATDLADPRSVLSGAVPELKASEHYFVDLAKSEEFLQSWTRSGTLQPEVANKLAEWLDDGLKPWDISRDAPYFGFEIPETEGKYFYVWMDAPIGYMASFKDYCVRSGVDFDEFWRPESDCEVHHFIGKDIINFHALFWPAVLSAAGLPNADACTYARLHYRGGRKDVEISRHLHQCLDLSGPP